MVDIKLARKTGRAVRVFGKVPAYLVIYGTVFAYYDCQYVPDLPGNIINTSQSILSNDQLKLNPQVYKNTKKIRFDAISNLSATSPFIIVYNRVPVRDDVPYHSIIGIGDFEIGPGSSDGVVPYESSHIDFAVSERLVHFNHGAHQHPDAIDEVKRILLLHLEETEQGMQ